MGGGFGDVDPEWERFDRDHPGWRDAGLNAVEAVLDRGRFTTVDVWAAWLGPRPEEPRRIAEVMDEAVRLGLCRRSGVTAGHTRRSGHAGYGSVYVAVSPRGVDDPRL